MTESRDLQAVFAEAEQAAGAGDYFAAERLLRKAADVQEAQLGPFHPDLANTINNLGVVYETLDRPEDAERCYRRAYSIAIASLEPDHPFVVTSEKNFREFCEARGIPFDLPKPLPPPEPAPELLQPEVSVPVDTPPEPRVEVVEAPRPVQPEPEPELPLAAQIDTPAPPQPSHEPREPRQEAPMPMPPAATGAAPSRPFPMAVAGVLGLAAVAVIAVWLGSDGSVDSSGSAQSSERSSPLALDNMGKSSAAPSLESASSVAGAASTSSTSPVPGAVGKPGIAETTPGTNPTAGRAERAVSPTVSKPSAAPGLSIEASLCSGLSPREWRCSAASRPADSGVLFFYTRIKSPASLTVEHRWYHDDRLHRRVSLRVQSNERTGFRTYSRTAVEPGDWRVELRTREGALLHTETFAVR